MIVLSGCLIRSRQSESLFTDKVTSRINLKSALFVDVSFVPTSIIRRCGLRVEGLTFSCVYNPRTTKILHVHLIVFERMAEFISSNMFGNHRTFTLCYEALSFCAVVSGPFFPSFFDDCVPVFCLLKGVRKPTQF